MKKDCRLSAEDFAAVKKHGDTVRTGPLLVSALSGEKRRLGIVITRRTGGAVRRNRIRRIVSEFFRVNKQLFPVGDSVVIAGVGTSNLSNDEIRAHLEKAVGRLVVRLKKNE